MYGKRAPWEDPSKWVADTYPWSSATLQHEWPSLLQLRPEDVGYEGYASAKEGTTSKHVPQTETEGDPLVRVKLLSSSIQYALYSHMLNCTLCSKNVLCASSRTDFWNSSSYNLWKCWKWKEAGGHVSQYINMSLHCLYFPSGQMCLVSCIRSSSLYCLGTTLQQLINQFYHENIFIHQPILHLRYTNEGLQYLHYLTYLS